jgi:threonine/homoserine/homoserine lactone efflux protein
MDLQPWLIYLSVVLAVIVTPGPSALLCMTHGAAHGVGRTSATVAGGMCASLTLMTLSALGLSAAIAASDTLFHGIRLLGAAYLVYLGIATWRAAPPTLAVPSGTEASAGSQGGMRRSLFRKGLAVGIGNPKDLLFFGSLFPQFIEPGRPLALQLAVLAGTWLVVDGTVMMLYAKGGATVAARLRHGRFGVWFNRITGGAFVAAGGALAVAHR